MLLRRDRPCEDATCRDARPRHADCALHAKADDRGTVAVLPNAPRFAKKRKKATERRGTAFQVYGRKQPAQQKIGKAGSTEDT